jgi:hypothetical protein
LRELERRAARWTDDRRQGGQGGHFDLGVAIWANDDRHGTSSKGKEVKGRSQKTFEALPLLTQRANWDPKDEPILA